MMIGVKIGEEVKEGEGRRNVMGRSGSTNVSFKTESCQLFYRQTILLNSTLLPGDGHPLTEPEEVWFLVKWSCFSIP